MEPIDNSKQERIAILMATYNGRKYLGEQLDSILSQSNRQWHLYVHDDGSTDGTVELLADYAGRYPDRVTVMDYPSQGGALPNFMSLLEKVLKTADQLEEGRDYPGVEEMREFLKLPPDECVYNLMTHTREYVLSIGAKFDPLSDAAIEWLGQQIKQGEQNGQ